MDTLTGCPPISSLSNRTVGPLHAFACSEQIIRDVSEWLARTASGDRPAAVVLLGAWDECFLAEISQACMSACGSNPVVALTCDNIAFQQSVTADADCVTLHVSSWDVDAVQRGLRKKGFNNIDDVLFVWLFPGLCLRHWPDDLGAECFLADWSAHIGRHGFLLVEWDPEAFAKHGNSDMGIGEAAAKHTKGYASYRGFTVKSLLRFAAGAGLFAKHRYCRLYPTGTPVTCMTNLWLEKRSYSVRNATIDDLQHLVDLENACWNHGRRATAAALRERVKTFQAGQWVVSVAKKICGAVYSQRISDPARLFGVTCHEVSGLHETDGKIVQLLSVSVEPEMQHLGLGDELLEYVLQLSAACNNTEQVIAVSLCKSYRPGTGQSLAEYIDKRDATGLSIDPILRFHHLHGAEIVGLVPGFRPDDIDNEGNGVLVRYDIHHRKGREISTSGAEAVVTVDRATVRSVVEGSVIEVLGDARVAAYAPDMALMMMGMDSLDLLRLRSCLCERLAMDIEASFFFRHATTDAIAEALCAKCANDCAAPARQDEFKNGSLEVVEVVSVEHGCETVDSKCESPKIRSEDIAVIGIGCRLPGGVESAEDYWDLLIKGIDAIQTLPEERSEFASGGVTGDDAEIIPGYGGFLNAIDQFDASFFGISPREANAIDPQQRLLMEVGHEALEHAGIASRSLRGKAVGVFVGLFSHDYELLQVKNSAATLSEPYYSTGNAPSMAAGRIAFLNGFTGPAITVDTACSSSLVAVHLACNSLRQGECAVALAGGVNLILSHELSLSFARAGMLAPDGRCKTFDADANGYVRSEGCGVVVLKPLGAAIEDGDRIHAVISGSAVNQDGASNGLTAPNQTAQEDVIEQALRRSGFAPADIGYVEAHGTGTPLGDPVEMHALRSVYGQDRAPEAPLTVGSVKTNIGHTEAAAGVAGLIKAILAVEHGYIPQHLHFRQQNKHIDLASIPAVVPVDGRSWQTHSACGRVAAVSSFGFSGTNAHLIVREAYTAKPEQSGSARDCYVFPVSAQSEDALSDLVQRHLAGIQVADGVLPSDLCHTAATGRNHYRVRRAFVVSTMQELMTSLQVGQSVQSRIARRSSKGGIAFLFTGQGSQSIGMGAQLYKSHDGFRETMDRCAMILSDFLDEPLLDVMFGLSSNEKLLDQTGYTQPALFALEYSLARLWMSWGVQPDYLIGHSVGEYVAACLAGVMSLEDGCRMIAARARLMQSLPEGGAMAAILAPGEQVAKALLGCNGRAAIAAYNGPCNTVISGESSAVNAICEEFEQSSVSTRRLHVSHAFHSPLMEPMLEEFRNTLAGIEFAQPKIPIISNLTGMRAGMEVATADYWIDHVRSPVQFAQSMDRLRHHGVDTFIEVGPRPVLIGMGMACVSSEDSMWLTSLQPGESEWRSLSRSVAEYYSRGGDIDWNEFFRPGKYRRAELPTYPFERRRFWFEPSQKIQHRISRKALSHACHPLLGERLSSPLDSVQYATDLRQERLDFLQEHRVYSSILFPAAAYIEMMLAAVSDLSPSGHPTLEDAEFVRPLVLDMERTIDMRCVFTPDSQKHETDWSASIHSQPAGGSGAAAPWELHARGRAFTRDNVPSSLVPLDQARLQRFEQRDIGSFYARLEERGYDYGEGFRAVRELRLGEQELVAKVVLPDRFLNSGEGYLVHPVLLDGCFQAVLSITDGGVFVPVSVGRVAITGTFDASVTVHAIAKSPVTESSRYVEADMTFYADDGHVIGHITELRCARVSPDQLLDAGRQEEDDWNYVVDWRERDLDFAAADCGLSEARADIIASLDERTKMISRRYSASNDPGKLRALEGLASDFIAEAIVALGVDLSPGTWIDSDFPETVSGGHEGSCSQIRRFLEILVDAGYLKHDRGQWRVAKSYSGNAKQELRHLKEACPDLAVELDLLETCGMHLTEVLRGERDVLDLLFPAGDVDSMNRFYQSANTFGDMNHLLAEAVAVQTRHARGNRPLRILEIGAGTGGVTGLVLSLIKNMNVQYVFTDVSKLFLSRARDRFSQYEWISYKLFDAERDPSGQGFMRNTFDIVLGANVVHATRDLSTSVGNIRSLLTDGGSMVLLEGSAKRRWIDLIFGLTDGWWRFRDHHLRPAHPLLFDSQWQELLRTTGFSDVRTFCPDPDDERMLFKQSLVVGFASVKESGVGHNKPVRLIFADGRGYGDMLAERFADFGEEPLLIRRCHDDGGWRCGEYHVGLEHAEALAAMFRELHAAGRILSGVVYMWGLDAPAMDIAMDSGGVAQLAESGYGGLLRVVRSMAEEGGGERRLCIVTAGAQHTQSGDALSGLSQAAIWGMAKVINLEHPEMNCTCIDIDPEAGDANIAPLFDEITTQVSEEYVAFRGGRRLVARLTRYRKGAREELVKKADNENFQLKLLGRGTLDCISLQSVPRIRLGANEVEIEVHAGGLNFRDLLNALGHYPGDPGELGDECAGVVSAVGEAVEGLSPGDRVMAMAPGGFRRFVNVDARLVCPLPGNFSFEAAGTIPVVFLTVYYALRHVMRLRKGQRILIHAAAGGVGQSAIQLARNAGAEIFATASPEKWGVLRELGVDKIFSSRDPDFAGRISELTSGQGVDIVLNSLSGKFISATLSVLGNNGIFLELGKNGIWSHEQMRSTRPDVAYHVIDMLAIRKHDPDLIQNLFKEVMRSLETGAVEPIPHQVFPITEYMDAFRLMQQGRHTGKLAFSITPPATASAGRSVRIRDDSTYLITGGLGGLGLAVSDWLIRRGARRLVLLGRTGGDQATQEKVRTLRNAGAEVVVVKADVTDFETMRRVVANAMNDAKPLRGVIHAVGVLEDGALVQQSVHGFEKVMAPKVEGAWNLHRLTASLDLDFFLLFSSTASLLGTPGQGNHAAANAVLDQLAFLRREQGLPATAINWGAWSDIGAAARRDVAGRWARRGLGAIHPEGGIRVVETLMNGSPPQVGVVPVDWQRYLEQLDQNRIWRFYEEFREIAATQRAASSQPKIVALDAGKLRDRLRVGNVDGLDAYLAGQIVRVLHLDKDATVSAERSLNELGLDSLTGIELRNTINRDLGVKMSLEEFFTDASIRRWIDMITDHLARVTRDEPEQVMIDGPDGPYEELTL